MLQLLLMDSQKVVIPAEAGIQTTINIFKTLDSFFQGNDGIWLPATFCESILLLANRED
jgi:hypothetical protein